jgi:hypothetical protein
MSSQSFLCNVARPSESAAMERISPRGAPANQLDDGIDDTFVLSPVEFLEVGRMRSVFNFEAALRISTSEPSSSD